MDDETDRPIRFNEPYLSGRELAYLKEVFESRSFAGNGPFTRRVQRFLEERYGVARVLLTHSCSAALEMAALLLDPAPGDQVLVPSFTFPTTASAFVRAGAEVVFCELDPSTMNLDVADAAARVTERTRAIVPIHYAGLPADMDAVLELARRHGLTVIEDAAQGLGTRFRGRWLGCIGDLGAISFHETKNIHSGLGGALFVNDESWFERAEAIWERGTNRARALKGLVDKYSWVELGSSFYPSELQAAFLLAQLESYDENLKRRQWIQDRYRAFLEPLAARGCLRLPRVLEGTEHNHHALFVILESIAECDALREHLSARSIQAYIGFVPLHSSRMGVRLGNDPDALPVTQELAQRVLRLPFHNDLDERDMQRIQREFERFFGQRSTGEHSAAKQSTGTGT
jgi:dTDP-4-amino-4,6-dideoxygalactose transaminase